MEKLAFMRDSFTVIYGGHHRFPVENDYLDRYIHCALGILNGTISKKKHSARGETYYSVSCENIRISLPSEKTGEQV
jgi:hypothetical protein